MRPRDFSAVISLCALFAVVLITQTVRAQPLPVWLQGDPSDADPDLERLNRSFVRLAEKVRQAVVHVRVEPTQARGSGFIIDPQGYILTAHHVVNEAKEIEIRLANRQRLRGEIVATDAQVDFAIIKINGEREFPVLPLGDSDVLRVGELVGSLGYPFGLESSLHMGIVSRRGRRQNTFAAFDHIQVDSPANSGESGGLSPVRGVLVSSVAADQPADRAGVLSQDVILAVDDIAVDRVGEVLRVIKSTEVGNEVTLTIFRSGETFVVPVRLGKKPIAQDDPEE
jgi:S1-C subfamily serine protease